MKGLAIMITLVSMFYVLTEEQTWAQIATSAMLWYYISPHVLLPKKRIVAAVAITAVAVYQFSFSLEILPSILYGIMLIGDTIYVVSSFDLVDPDNCHSLEANLKRAKKEGKLVLCFIVGRPFDPRHKPLTIKEIEGDLWVELHMTSPTQKEELVNRCKKKNVEYQLEKNLLLFKGPQNIPHICVKAVEAETDKDKKYLSESGEKELQQNLWLYKLCLGELWDYFLPVYGGNARKEGISGWAFSVTPAFTSRDGHDVASTQEYKAQKDEMLEMSPEDREVWSLSKLKVKPLAFYFGLALTYAYVLTKRILCRDRVLLCGGPFTAVAKLLVFPGISFTQSIAMAFTRDASMNILGGNFNCVVDMLATRKVFDDYLTKLGKVLLIPTDSVKETSIPVIDSIGNRRIRKFTKVWAYSKPKGEPQPTFDIYVTLKALNLSSEYVKLINSNEIEYTDKETIIKAVHPMTHDQCQEYMRDVDLYR